MIKTNRNCIGNVALLTGILTCLICWQSSYLFAQQKAEEETSDKPVELRAPSVTEHTITVDGESINYSATVGYMIQTDADSKPIGYFFYTAYTKQDEDSVSRPLTFCFNGGPGSSSIYLHMLTIGPRKAVLLEDGNTPAPPPRMVDNVDTWLSFTDLVFIDPIGTGFSFPHPGADTKQFWVLQRMPSPLAISFAWYTASRRSSSWTGTTTTGMAPRTCSTAIPRCCFSQAHDFFA